MKQTTPKQLVWHLITSFSDKKTVCGLSNTKFAMRLPHDTDCKNCKRTKAHKDAAYTLEIGFEGSKRAFLEHLDKKEEEETQ